jgi:hypothetical protein
LYLKYTDSVQTPVGILLYASTKIIINVLCISVRKLRYDVTIWNPTIGLCIQLSSGHPREISIESAPGGNECPVVCAKSDNKKWPKCDNRPPVSEKTQCHLPGAAHRSSQPLSKHPTPRTILQQKTQKALSRRPGH